MASFINVIPSSQGPLDLKFSFLGTTHHLPNLSNCQKALPRLAKMSFVPTAKFNLMEVMGGRGLCSGETGLQLELKRSVEAPQTLDQISSNNIEQQDQLETSCVSSSSGSDDDDKLFQVGENAFEKELMGLTGGFPGGEKGLKTFIDKCPAANAAGTRDHHRQLGVIGKPKPPQLPLLMPGMIAIVKNPNNPFYMYCGIIQRITDGKAGVLFEGGNWDKLITFRLDELERRDKGPPMVNPKSAVLESLAPKES